MVLVHAVTISLHPADKRSVDQCKRADQYGLSRRASLAYPELRMRMRVQCYYSGQAQNRKRTCVERLLRETFSPVRIL